jgi:RNA-directed DNA polymerase
VKEAAKRNKHLRFTALLHHVDVGALERAFRRLKRRANAGVDGETVDMYEEGLQGKLKSLHSRIHTGNYRPHPVRRVYIPKADGGQRPLGVPTLEDKIVQGAVAELLNAIYEVDFMGFSYGFRPGRSPHSALSALRSALISQRVNWVLDADIRRFFDSVDHEWLMRMIAHRIADPRILGLIRGWLTAGVMEGERWIETEEGTPQGAGISPLLANIFLHYVFDLWAHQWRNRHADGPVVMVRYADDFVLGFQSKKDAERMLVELRERLAKFGLELHEEKTRLIAFGQYEAERRQREGQPRLKTFAFLGLTHYYGKARSGRLVVKCKTQSKRVTRKLTELRRSMRQRLHDALEIQHRWLSSVLRGHYAYFGVPGNFAALNAFHHQVKRIWCRGLQRRSQRAGMTWERFNAMLERYPLPLPRITQPWTILNA